MDNRYDILSIIELGELTAVTYKPEEHPMRCLHLVWGIRDAINDYFNSDDKPAFIRDIRASINAEFDRINSRAEARIITNDRT